MPKKVYDLTKPAPESCPRFQTCCSNYCPLESKTYKTDPSDTMTRCKVAKNVRKRIAKAFGLRDGGLKPRELTAKKRWDNLPQKEKDRRIDALKKLSPVSRCLEKGLIVQRKTTTQTLKPHTKTGKSAENNATEQTSGVGE